MTAESAYKTCPRCGFRIVQRQRGRPRKWCSDECRRRGAEQGIQVHEVVRTREVRVAERISTARQIERLLDDPDATELLVRTLAYRWQHRRPDEDRARHRALRSLVPDLWQSFHAPVDPAAAKKPPARVPTAAAQYTAAVEKVLGSPRAIRTVLMRVRNGIDAGEFGGPADEPVLNGLAYLNRPGRRF